MPKTTTCKSCRNPIFFAVTTKSENTPVDAYPHTEGNLHVRFTDPPQAAVVTLGQAAGMRAAGIQLYRSHFATCPNADEFRSRARTKTRSTR